MSLNIVVALHCEAKSLIEYFQLKKIMQHNLPFPIFVNKDKNIHLIISGVGKIKAAAATTFLAMWTDRLTACTFLNVGIAGATQFARDNFIIAHKIIEDSTQRSWYPFVTP